MAICRVSAVMLFLCTKDLMQDITDGISASVRSYTISVMATGISSAPELNVTLEGDDDTVCKSICQYTFQNMTDLTALHYSVFITAQNVLYNGHSERKICNSIPLCE